MRIGRLAHSVFACCVAGGALNGCGGGYGGGMSGPMPSVAFSAPAEGSTINFGEAVTLTWTSSYATSCIASASSGIGGAFSGSQSTSGTASVAPTAAGSVSYTLNCSGAGGTAMATTAAITVKPSILSTLSATGITTIGSTLDPIEHGGNPYGLAVAPVTAGLISAGDLIVCNFNDGATNMQGHGTTIVGLHPTAGAMPYRIAQSATLEGCNALAMLPDDSISASAFVANQTALVTSAGVVDTPFAADTFAAPWGQTYVAAHGTDAAALYVSNGDGSIDRITLSGDGQTAFMQIASGFCGSGVPGAVFAPAGLTYDASSDTLYIVDTSSNSVVALAGVSAIGTGGVVADGQCASVSSPPTPEPSFTGASASSARVIAHGEPLIAPISAALLADGTLIVGNGDINIAAGQMPNLAVEVSPWLPGGFVGQAVQLDTSGTPGALFGIVATTDASGNQLIYFNDDNSNSVMLLSK